MSGGEFIPDIGLVIIPLATAAILAEALVTLSRESTSTKSWKLRLVTNKRHILKVFLTILNSNDFQGVTVCLNSMTENKMLFIHDSISNHDNKNIMVKQDVTNELKKNNKRNSIYPYIMNEPIILQLTKL